MYNFKKRMRMTVAMWIFIAALAALTIISQAMINDADAAEKKVMPGKTVASLIMWYTATGVPQNCWFLDLTDYRVLGNGTILIDRNRGDVVDFEEAVMGGLVSIQNFGYYEVFDKNNRLKGKYNNFALNFKRKAGEHLGFAKPDKK